MSFLVFTISLQNKEFVEIMTRLINDIWHHVDSCSADYQRKPINNVKNFPLGSSHLFVLIRNPAFNFCVMQESVVLDVVHISYEGCPKICPIKRKSKTRHKKQADKNCINFSASEKLKSCILG